MYSQKCMDFNRRWHNIFPLQTEFLFYGYNVYAILNICKGDKITILPDALYFWPFSVVFDHSQSLMQQLWIF